jgi:predicted nucleic acid-binding protein
MRILLDTNIAQDALERREPFSSLAQQVIATALNHGFDPCLTANATTDIYYVIRKHLGADAASVALDNLFEAFTVLSVTEADCLRACAANLQDYEDALMIACAQREKVGHLITRDEQLLKTATVEAVIILSPESFIKSLL